MLSSETTFPFIQHLPIFIKGKYLGTHAKETKSIFFLQYPLSATVSQEFKQNFKVKIKKPQNLTQSNTQSITHLLFHM